MTLPEELYTPAVSHRFIVNFLFKGLLPSPVDIRFQRVSGLGRELQVEQRHQGGENARNHWLAERVQHNSLILERGVMVVTPLTLMFDQVMRGETLNWADVVIILLDRAQRPITSWTLSNALPVRWQTGDLDANSNQVLINTLELRYEDMRIIGVKL
ncbi:phage tail protein [Photorhabdus australis]|uniref:phage tail protein n=1 Tax=Photorhabdus australis TaxID=286156 RepID=UPI0005682D46|nr:phage tail protein [Photorhabdus australis]